jgi:hypothetical protein
LIAVVVVALLGRVFIWPAHDPARECLDLIHVGMPAEEARRVLEGRGFALGDAVANHLEITGAYERAGTRSLIICVDMLTHKVTCKELESRNTLRELWQRLTWQLSLRLEYWFLVPVVGDRPETPR